MENIHVPPINPAQTPQQSFADAYRQQAAAIQQEYNSKLQQLQHWSNDYQNQLRAALAPQFPSSPFPQTPPPAAAPPAPPVPPAPQDQGVPPHIQQLTALGDIKTVLEAILSRLPEVAAPATQQEVAKPAVSNKPTPNPPKA